MRLGGDRAHALGRHQGLGGLNRAGCDGYGERLVWDGEDASRALLRVAAKNVPLKHVRKAVAEAVGEEEAGALASDEAIRVSGLSKQGGWGSSETRATRARQGARGGGGGTAVPPRPPPRARAADPRARRAARGAAAAGMLPGSPRAQSAPSPRVSLPTPVAPPPVAPRGGPARAVYATRGRGSRRRLRWTVGWGEAVDSPPPRRDGSKSARATRGASGGKGESNDRVRARIIQRHTMRTRASAARGVSSWGPPRSRRLRRRRRRRRHRSPGDMPTLKRGCCFRAPIVHIVAQPFARRLEVFVRGEVRLHDRAGLVLCYCAFEFFYSSFQCGDLVGLGRHWDGCMSGGMCRRAGMLAKPGCSKSL